MNDSSTSSSASTKTPEKIFTRQHLDDCAPDGRFLLEQITIPSHFVKIDVSAFQHCLSLEQVNLFPHASLTEIGMFAFCNCRSLMKIKLPNSTKKICHNAFDNCYSLEEVIFPESLTEIGNEAFHLCSALEEVIFPESLTKIGYKAFRWCSSLKKVIFPESLTEIDYQSFEKCRSLKYIVVSESCQTIGYHAFGDCSSLIYAYLPKSLKSIGEDAFSDCHSLSVIAVPSHCIIEQDAFHDCNVINQLCETIQMEEDKLLQQRFHDLPLHQVCYNPHVTLDSLTASITQLQDVDAFSMNALHILCSNPSATHDMFSKLLNACPSLPSMQSVEGLTPSVMYVKSKYDCNDIIVNKTRFSLENFLQHKILRQDSIVYLLALDDQMQAERRRLYIKDEETGLFPFMLIASDGSYNLNSLYWLLREHPYLLNDFASTAFCNIDKVEVEELKKQNRAMKKKIELMTKQSNDQMEELKRQLKDVRIELEELKLQSKATMKTAKKKRKAEHDRSGTLEHT